MADGLFLDPRAWAIDIQASPFWNPKKFGVNIALYPSAFHIPQAGIHPKYKFAITTEVWEIPMRKALEYLRSKGIKIFLMPREPFKTEILKDAMFSYERFLHNGEYYFTPDAILSPSQAYADLWKDKAKSHITGYTRFDYYVNKSAWRTKQQVAEEYGLKANKKWIFFPSYPPYHYKKVDGKDVMVDLFDAREETIQALKEFSDKHKDYQIVIKIHPASMKPFRKGTGNGKEVAGLLKYYYKHPTDNIKVIGDNRQSGLIAKELLINSDIICGFTSTMLLEAGLLKKPVVHVLFNNTKDLGGIPEYAKHIPVAYNKAELHTLLKSPKAVNNPMIEKYLYKVDGKTCERICEAIKQEIK